MFVGRVIERVEGNTPIEKERLLRQRVVGLRSFGKHFLVELGAFSLRVHLLMLGSYCINERKDKPIRLGLGFTQGDGINFYSCSVKFVEEPLAEVYDWRLDVMADQWDPALARKNLRALPETLLCDALLDQSVFAGVGNVIKNEILFRLRLHPLSTVGVLPPHKLQAGDAGAAVHLRVLQMEESRYGWQHAGLARRNAQRALAGAQQEDVPAVRRRVDQSSSRHARPAQLLLRKLPGAARVGREGQRWA